MSPEQFQQRIQKHRPAPVYLFVGPEPHQRDACRRALIEKVLTPDQMADGLTRHDLEDTPIAAVLDDACSMSLFAADRVIWVTGAEAALPKRLTAESAEEGSAGAALAAYIRNPTPGVVLVFDSGRYEFDGEDKPRMDRVLKFYGMIPEQVEFRPYTADMARRLAQETARKLGLQIGSAELGILVEAMGADGARIAAEIEKLSLYAGRDRKVTEEDIRQLVPNAQASTIFGLVNALGKGDRKRSLDSLDILMREGEYLPLALTFLSTQFRLALVAQEAKLQNAQQIQAYFTRQGVRIWRERAEQVQQTMAAFPKERLAVAVERLSWADRALRDTRPDDRVVMEDLVLSITR